MVERASGYQGETFKGYRGVTQGDPLSPTIFNVIVDAVLCHLVTVVAGEEEDPDGFGRAAGCIVKFFYTDNRLLDYTREEQLQWEFNMLTNLFDRVGLRMDVRKTVSVVCQPCQSVGGNPAEAYKRRIIGMGITYQACQFQNVRCPE